MGRNIPKADMAFENGVENLRFYNSGSKSLEHELPCKVSCSQCGTLILDEGRNMVLLFPTLLSFRDVAQRKNFEVEYVALDLLLRDLYLTPHVDAISSILTELSTYWMASRNGQGWMARAI